VLDDIFFEAQNSLDEIDVDAVAFSELVGNVEVGALMHE
jgi:hypothetical protein